MSSTQPLPYYHNLLNQPYPTKIHNIILTTHAEMDCLKAVISLSNLTPSASTSQQPTVLPDHTSKPFITSYSSSNQQYIQSTPPKQQYTPPIEPISLSPLTEEELQVLTQSTL